MVSPLTPNFDLPQRFQSAPHLLNTPDFPNRLGADPGFFGTEGAVRSCVWIIAW